MHMGKDHIDTCNILEYRSIFYTSTACTLASLSHHPLCHCYSDMSKNTLSSRCRYRQRL